MRMANTLQASQAVRDPGPRESRRPQPNGRGAVVIQLLGAILVVSAILVAVFSSGAGASALSNGTVSLTGVTNNVVVNNPLENQQVIAVNVAANTTLDRSSLEAAGYPSRRRPSRCLSVPTRVGRPRACPPSRRSVSL